MISFEFQKYSMSYSRPQHLSLFKQTRLFPIPQSYPSRLMTILQVIFRYLCSVLTSVVVHHSHHGRPSKASENSVFGGIPFHPTARHSQRHRDTPCHEFLNCTSGYVTSNNNTRRACALIVKTWLYVRTCLQMQHRSETMLSVV